MLALTKSAEQLSFADRVAAFLERVDYRCADTAVDKEAIYRLRYDAYLREGAIEASASRRFTDKYDDMDNTWIFGVYLDDILCGSIRVSVALPGYPVIPASMVFPDFVEPEVAAGRIIVDSTRFVVDREMSRHFPALPYVTIRLGCLGVVHFGADFGLATVRAEHQAFYRRLLGHTVVCEPRHYPTLTKPISLMQLNYDAESQAEILRRYPFFHSSAFERRMLFDRPRLRLSRSAA